MNALYFTIGSLALSLSLALATCGHAGDLRVTRSGGQITVESLVDGTDDNLLIYPPVNGWIHFEGRNGTTMWGRSTLNLPANSNTDLTIRLGDGNDSVTIEDYPSLRNVNLDLGASGVSANDQDDVFVDGIIYKGSLIVSTGDDDDIVRLEKVFNWSPSSTSWLFVYGGRGSDSIGLSDSNYMADFLIVDTNDARSPDFSRDYLGFTSSYTPFAWLIGGPGVDEVSLFDARCDDMSLLTKGGSDYIDVLNSELTDIYISASSGVDEINFRNNEGTIATLDGGSSNADSVNFASNNFGTFNYRNFEIVNGRRLWNQIKMYIPKNVFAYGGFR